MKKIAILVKQVLMSTLTAGMFAVSFTACTADDDLLNEACEPKVEQKAQNGPLEAVGLMFNDFLTINDVQILNDDTTQIAISKAFADKKGINNFVNRPMGIWINFRDASFLCKGTAQRLVGDRYIVDVVEATFDEVIQPGHELRLKTDLFFNHTAAEQGQTRSGEGMENSQLMESMFTDDAGYIHPAAIRFSGEAATRSGANPNMNYSPLEILGLLDENGAQTRGFWGDAWNVVKNVARHVARATIDPFGINEAFIDFVTSDDDDQTEGNFHNNLVKWTGTQTFTNKIKCGQGKNDTITIRAKIPSSFIVNYTLDLKVGGELTSPRMDYFRASLDGEMKTAPELTVGFSKALEIPKDLQKIKIHEFEGASVTFTVYGIPVNITFKPSLYFKLKAKCEGSVYTGIKYEYDTKFSAGCEYSNSKWKDLNGVQIVKNEFSFIPPTADFKVNAGFGVMLGCDILFEKVAGPYVAAGPQVGLNLNLKVVPTSEEKPIIFTGDCKLGFWGEAGAKVTIWKWDVLNYYHEFDFGLSKTLWDYKYPEASGKENNPITKALDTATEYFRNLQNEVKSQL